MAKYAKDQPAGFTNRIENVAIVGVIPPALILLSTSTTELTNCV